MKKFLNKLILLLIIHICLLACKGGLKKSSELAGYANPNENSKQGDGGGGETEAQRLERERRDKINVASAELLNFTTELKNKSNEFYQLALSTPESLVEYKEAYERDMASIRKNAESIINQYSSEKDMAVCIKEFNTVMDDFGKELTTAVENRINKMNESEKKKYEDFLSLDPNGREFANRGRKKIIEKLVLDVKPKTEEINTKYEEIKAELAKATESALAAAISLNRGLTHLIKTRKSCLDGIKENGGVSLDSKNFKVGDKSYTVPDLAQGVLDSSDLIINLKEKLFMEKLNQSQKDVEKAYETLRVIDFGTGFVIDDKLKTAMNDYSTHYYAALNSVSNTEIFYDTQNEYNSSAKHPDQMKAPLEKLQAGQAANKALFDKTPHKIKIIKDTAANQVVIFLSRYLSKDFFNELFNYSSTASVLARLTSTNYEQYYKALNKVKIEIERIEATYKSVILDSEYKAELEEKAEVKKIKSDIDNANMKYALKKQSAEAEIIKIAENGVSKIEAYIGKLKAEKEKYLNCKNTKANPDDLKLDKDLHNKGSKDINQEPYTTEISNITSILTSPLIKDSVEKIKSKLKNANDEFCKLIKEIEAARKEADNVFAQDLSEKDTTVAGNLSKAQNLCNEIKGYWKGANLAEADKKNKEIKELSTRSRAIYGEVKEIKNLDSKNKDSQKSIEKHYNDILKLEAEADSIYNSMKNASENGNYTELAAFKNLSPKTIEALSSFTKDQLVAVKKIEGAIPIIRYELQQNILSKRILALKNAKDNLDLLVNFIIYNNDYYNNGSIRHKSEFEELFEAICKVQDKEKLKPLLDCKCIKNLDKDCIAALTSAEDFKKMKILLSQERLPLDKQIVEILASFEEEKIKRFVDTFKKLLKEGLPGWDSFVLNKKGTEILAQMADDKWPIVASLYPLGRYATRKLLIFNVVKKENIKLYNDAYESLGIVSFTGVSQDELEGITELEKITDQEKLKSVLGTENLLKKSIEEIKAIVAEKNS